MYALNVEFHIVKRYVDISFAGGVIKNDLCPNAIMLFKYEVTSKFAY